MPNSSTVRAVVRYIGLATLALIVVMYLLLKQVIAQGAGGQTIDAATLGAVTSIGTLTGAALGSLGTLLASTRGADDPAPVQVVNEADDAVPVEEAE